jgi:putative hydrolase of the HAD superfamily
MVLTGPPDPAAHEEMQRVTGLDVSLLDMLYWRHRHAFDEGSFTGGRFWREVAKDAGLNLSESQIDELVHWDARMWMDLNQAMLSWQVALKERGLLTAIVSNMGDTVHREMEREFEWLSRFDVLVWSYQLRLAKPDLAIYRHVLEKLGTLPGETLFVDDRPPNVDAARSLGMMGAVFTDSAQLRADLVATGLDSELPLP